MNIAHSVVLNAKRPLASGYDLDCRPAQQALKAKKRKVWDVWLALATIFPLINYHFIVIDKEKIMFRGYHLSSYQTDDPVVYKQILQEVAIQASRWLEDLQFSDEQKKQTQILSQILTSKKTGKEQFTVYLLVPLNDWPDNFSAIWEGLLAMTRGEELSMKVEQLGIVEETLASKVNMETNKDSEY